MGEGGSQRVCLLHQQQLGLFLDSPHFVFPSFIYLFFFFLRKKQEVGALLRIAVNVIEFLMFSNKQTIEKLRMEKYKQCFLKCHCTGKHMFWVKLSSFLVTVLTLWWPWPAGIWGMEGGSFYQIRSKREERVFGVFFFFFFLVFFRKQSGKGK